MSDFSIRFWGTRGSRPVSGESFRQFGGHTTCMEVRIAGRRFVVDAGSGAPELGARLLAESEASARVLLTHLHLDHIMGLVAFAPLYAPGFPVRLHAPRRDNASLDESLSILFREPFNPIGFETLPAQIELATFAAGETLEIEDMRLRTLPLRHSPGTAGYRFDHGGRTLAIITDYEHAGSEPERALVEFCAGADLIVYDAMRCQDSDYDAHRGWGHSTWQAGVELLRSAGAERLICTHHAPEADDTLLAAREAQLARKAPGSAFARDGAVYRL